MNSVSEWLRPEAVMEAVSQVSAIPREIILGRSRVQEVSMARKVMTNLLYRRSRMTFMAIAGLMSQRDHSSIMYLNKAALKMPRGLVRLHEDKAESFHLRMMADVQM